MSLLKAYLESPNTKRVLSRKPGEKGFSLIELVVVVAVLAILAAIAIPQFSQLSDDARLNSTKSIMANMYKECEFNKARTGSGFHTVQKDGTPNGVTWSGDSKDGAKDGTGCDSIASATIGTGTTCHVAMNLKDGTQYYDKASSLPGTWSKGHWPANLENCT